MNIDINLHEIYFKIAARSKYFRENFDELEAGLDNLQAQINAGFIASSGSEVSQARGAADSLDQRLSLAFSLFPNAIIEGFEVEELPSANMQIKVKAGRAVVNGAFCQRGYASWTRSGTLITITETAHGLVSTDKIYIDVTSDAAAAPVGEYGVTKIDDDTFTITGNNAGATSGTFEFSRYSALISAPATNKYTLHKVVINSGNQITIKNSPEYAAADKKLFPQETNSELGIAGLYIAYNTTTLQNNINIFDFIGVSNIYPDVYLDSEIQTDSYHFNNCVLNGSITIKRPYGYSDGYKAEITEKYFAIKCEGNYFETAACSLTIEKVDVSDDFIISNNIPVFDDTGFSVKDVSSNDVMISRLRGFKQARGNFESMLPSYGGRADTSASGCGGGSIVANGGADGHAEGIGSTERNNGIKPAHLLQAENILLNADRDLSGGNGNGVVGNYGNGGHAGSLFYVKAWSNIEVSSSITIDVSGGDGAAGTSQNGCGGGGGLILIGNNTGTKPALPYAGYIVSGGSGQVNGTDGVIEYFTVIENGIYNLSSEWEGKKQKMFDEIFEKIS